MLPPASQTRNNGRPDGSWRLLLVVVPYLLLALAFSFQMFAMETPVSSPEDLEHELLLDEPGAEPLYARPPFKYRYGFQALVDGGSWILGGSKETFVTGGERFWLSFVLVSLACWMLALAGITRLMRLLELTANQVFFGQLAFITAFPMIHAYGYPCHTREDPLAYALVAFGLCSWIQKRYLWLLSLSVAAAATREPTLVLAGSFFLLGKTTAAWRAGILAASIGAALMVRLVMGFEVHDIGRGAARVWSRMAEETTLCVVLSLSWMWVTFFLVLIDRRLWPDKPVGGRAHSATCGRPTRARSPPPGSRARWASPTGWPRPSAWPSPPS